MALERRFTGILIGFALALAALGVALGATLGAPATAWAGDGVRTFDYVTRSWDGSQVVAETKTMNAYDYVWWTEGHMNLHNGWWYTRDVDTEADDRVEVDAGATVNLILWDDVAMEFEDGIRVPSNTP